MPQSGKIREAQVEHLHIILLGEVENCLRVSLGLRQGISGRIPKDTPPIGPSEYNDFIEQHKLGLWNATAAHQAQAALEQHFA